MTKRGNRVCQISESAQTAAVIRAYLAMPYPSDTEAVATRETVFAIARQLTGALTAFLLDVNEIKLRSNEHLNLSENGSLRDLLGNTLHQIESARASLRQLNVPATFPARRLSVSNHHVRKDAGGSAVMLIRAKRMPLTAREREALGFVCEGYSSKQGALEMRISPQTFECHRSEVMRKLGARNTADLVRIVLLHSRDI